MQFSVFSSGCLEYVQTRMHLKNLKKELGT